MEYLVVLVFVGVVLLVASNAMVLGIGAEGAPGPLGRQLQGFYQRTMGGISLPVP